MTSEAGASEDQGERAAAVWVEGKPANPDGASPRRQSGWLVGNRVSAPRHSARTSRKRSSPARGRLVGDAQRGERELAIGLLPTEPAVRGQAGSEDSRAGVDPVDRDS